MAAPTATFYEKLDLLPATVSMSECHLRPRVEPSLAGTRSLSLHSWNSPLCCGHRSLSWGHRGRHLPPPHHPCRGAEALHTLQYGTATVGGQPTRRTRRTHNLQIYHASIRKSLPGFLQGQRGGRRCCHSQIRDEVVLVGPKRRK